MSRVEDPISNLRAASREREPLLPRDSAQENGLSKASGQHGGDETITRSRGIILGLSVFTLIFILTSNVSLMTTIQSPIAEELGASSEVTWFNSAYLIAVTSLTPISGKLCQIFTPRVYLLTSIIIQAIGLAITAEAPSTSFFLMGRAICGMGSAAVTPVSFILVTKLVPAQRRGIFFGMINTGYTTGLACGAIVAGALQPLVGWRPIFWMQIPVTVLAACVAFVFIPRNAKDKEASQGRMLTKLGRIDFFGAFILLITLVLMLYTLSAPKIDFRAVGLSIGALALFVFVETSWAVEPIVPPSVMRSRANMLSGIATVGVMTARWGVLFYTPVYAIAVRGFKPSAAGALLVPTNAGFATGGLLVGWLHIRRTGSFYTPTLICFGLFGVIQFGLAELVTQDSPLWLFITSLFLNGLVVGALLNYSLAHLLHLTPSSQHMIVIPFNATFRSFSGSFGSAICGGYFLRTLYVNLYEGFESIGRSSNDALVKRLVGSPLLVQSLAGDEKTVAVDAYNSALRSTFFAGVGLAVIMLAIQAGVGWVTPKDPEDRDETDPDEIRRIVSREAATT